MDWFLGGRSIYQPGALQDLTYSTDSCPSPAPLMAGSGGGELTAVSRSIKPTLKKKGMVSEAELDAMGADPETEKRRTKQGGSCGSPERSK